MTARKTYRQLSLEVVAKHPGVHIQDVVQHIRTIDGRRPDSKLIAKLLREAVTARQLTRHRPEKDIKGFRYWPALHPDAPTALNSAKASPTAIPAFPQQRRDFDADPTGPLRLQGGMTLRDYFAAKAMQALFSIGKRLAPWEDIPQWAYSIADAMLAAREGQA